MRSRSRMLSFSLAFRGMCVFVWVTASVPLCFLQAEATTVTVGPGGNYATIQAAVYAANDGVEVVVLPGRYVENVVMIGRNIVLRSTDPRNTSVVETTIIDGNQAGTTLTFAGSETEECIVEGLTIRNGLNTEAGGVHGMGSTATIRYNRVVGNSATELNGGIREAHGLIQGNFISGNESGPDHGGGGLGHCGGMIIENVIVDNIGHGLGGGLHDCNEAYVSRNIIANNWSVEGGGIGGASGSVIVNNMIYGNYAECQGGGVCYGEAVLVNNTIVNNEAGVAGGGVAEISGDSARIVNCIIWSNSAPASADVLECTAPEYCCLSSGASSGTCNISANPQFEDEANHNYHLTLNSLCVDSGCAFAGVDTDFDFETRPIAGLYPGRGDGSGYDMGADEFLSGGDLVYLRTHTSGGGHIMPVEGLTLVLAGGSVKLTATALEGWQFRYWNGDVTGSENPVLLHMDAHKIVEAVFTSLEPLLYTAVQGKGSIYPPPGTYNYALGTEVTLTAVPGSGWHFAEWDGDIAGSPNPVTVKLDKYTTAIATFVESDSQTVECATGATSPAAWGGGFYAMGIVMAACWAASRMYVRWRRRSECSDPR